MQLLEDEQGLVLNQHIHVHYVVPNFNEKIIGIISATENSSRVVPREFQPNHNRIQVIYVDLHYTILSIYWKMCSTLDTLI